MGKHFPTLTLTQYGDGGAVIATVVLTDVTISDWRIGGEADGVSEQVQVSFLRFTFTDVASGNKFCWDLVASKGC
jgi:type VI protein secretion system component Hcp